MLTLVCRLFLVCCRVCCSGRTFHCLFAIPSPGDGALLQLQSGYSTSMLDDIWQSADAGMTWTRVTNTADASAALVPRVYAAVARKANKLVVVAGGDLGFAGYIAAADILQVSSVGSVPNGGLWTSSALQASLSGTVGAVTIDMASPGWVQFIVMSGEMKLTPGAGTGSLDTVTAATSVPWTVPVSKPSVTSFFTRPIYAMEGVNDLDLSSYGLVIGMGQYLVISTTEGAQIRIKPASPAPGQPLAVWRAPSYVGDVASLTATVFSTLPRSLHLSVKYYLSSHVPPSALLSSASWSFDFPRPRDGTSGGTRKPYTPGSGGGSGASWSPADVSVPLAGAQTGSGVATFASSVTNKIDLGSTANTVSRPLVLLGSSESVGLTLMFWLRHMEPFALPTGQTQLLWMQARSDSQGGIFNIYSINPARAAQFINVRYTNEDGTQQCALPGFGAAVPMHAYTHVAVTISEEFVMTLWLNANPSASVACGFPLPFLTRPLAWLGQGSASSDIFVGSMADLNVFQRLIGEDEMGALALTSPLQIPKPLSLIDVGNTNAFSFSRSFGVSYQNRLFLIGGTGFDGNLWGAAPTSNLCPLHMPPRPMLKGFPEAASGVVRSSPSKSMDVRNSDFSFSVWLSQDSFDSKNAGVFCFGEAERAGAGPMCLSTTPAGKFKWTWGSTAALTTTAGPPAYGDRWFHVAGTYRSATAHASNSGLLRLWVNGAQVGRALVRSSGPCFPMEDNGHLRLTADRHMDGAVIPAINTATKISVCVWVRRNAALATTQVLMGVGSADGAKVSLSLALQPGAISTSFFRLESSVGVNHPTADTLGYWTLQCGMFSPDTTTATGFISHCRNGVCVTQGGLGPSNLYTGTSVLRMSGDTANTVTVSYDEARLWYAALSPLQIYEGMTRNVWPGTGAGGLQVYYSFAPTALATDSSGMGLTYSYGGGTGASTAVAEAASTAPIGLAACGRTDFLDAPVRCNQQPSDGGRVLAAANIHGAVTVDSLVNTDITMCQWFAPTTLDSNNRVLLSIGNGAFTSALAIYMVGAQYRMHAMTPALAFEVPVSEATGVWSHFCLTYGPSTIHPATGSLASLWRNAIEFPVTGAGDYTGSNHVNIAGYPGVSQQANGMIDEVRLWTRMLSAREIKRGMRTGFFSAHKLQVYYKFTEADATASFADSSGNSRHWLLSAGTNSGGATHTQTGFTPFYPTMLPCTHDAWDQDASCYPRAASDGHVKFMAAMQATDPSKLPKTRLMITNVDVSICLSVRQHHSTAQRCAVCRRTGLCCDRLTLALCLSVFQLAPHRHCDRAVLRESGRNRTWSLSHLPCPDVGRLKPAQLRARWVEPVGWRGDHGGPRRVDACVRVVLERGATRCALRIHLPQRRGVRDCHGTDQRMGWRPRADQLGRQHRRKQRPRFSGHRRSAHLPARSVCR